MANELDWMDEYTIRLDMEHKGCGGFFESMAQRGFHHVFRCEKCHVEALSVVDESVGERHNAEMAAFNERLRVNAAAHPAPVPTGRLLTSEEVALIEAYEAWSEETYCARFMDPSEDIVTQFIEGPAPRKAWDYEEQFLETYARLKASS